MTQQIYFSFLADGEVLGFYGMAINRFCDDDDGPLFLYDVHLHKGVFVYLIRWSLCWSSFSSVQLAAIDETCAGSKKNISSMSLLS